MQWKREKNFHLYICACLEGVGYKSISCVGYFTTLSVSRLYSVKRLNDWWLKCWKLFGRKRQLSDRGTILGIAWRDWGESWKPSLIISGVPIEIRTEHLPNTSLEHYHHARSLSEKVPKNTAAIQVQSVKCDIWDFTAWICHCVAF